MNIEFFARGYIDFNQMLTDLILESNMNPKNEVHNQILKFSTEEMYQMDLDYSNCMVTGSFIDFSWSDDEIAIDITFSVDDGFSEFDRTELEDE